MKLKNTFLLLVLAIGLVAFIKFYESKQLGTRDAQDEAGKVVSFDRDVIRSITIKNSESKIELKKDDKGLWWLEDPVKDRADSLAVSQLFTSAEALRYDARIGDDKKGVDKDQMKEFGLANSETKLKFSGKDKTVEMVFGKDAAVDGKVYVRLEGTSSAYVIGKDLKDQISKKVDDFRDRKLTDINTAQVKKAAVKIGAGYIELEKKDQHWTVVKPLKARGDDSKIGDLISRAATAHIESFVGDTTNQAAFGLQEPRVTVSLWTEDKEKPTLIEIGVSPKEEKDKDKIYARASSREGVVLLPKIVEELILTKPNDLRDKSLIRIEPDIVDRINIEGAGKEKIVLARSGESWVRKAGDKDEVINVAAAKRVLDEVRNQQVSDFVSDVATDLAKYGLDQPQVKLTFSSYASENTAETKAGEKPIATLYFGKAENGKVYARLEDEPFIVSVPELLLDTLMTDPLQWQPLDIYKNKAEDIVSLEVTKDGQPPISLERGPDKAWKLAKGDGAVNQINAQSLANTLSTLRAVRWLGQPKPDYGLDRPLYIVAFKAANTAGKLIIGVKGPYDVVYATAEGHNGVFGISYPDFSAFELSLMEKPAAAVSLPPPPSSDPVTPMPEPAPVNPPAPTTEAPAAPMPPQP